MKAGVSTACLYPALLEDSLSDLVSRGIKTTEIFINTHCELMPDFINILKSILDSGNASCVALHPYTCPIEPMMLFSSYERRLKDSIDYCKYYFEAMNTIGAGIFVLHGNMNVTAVDEHLYFERFALLSEAAAGYGIILAQENVARCQSRSLSFLKNMSDYLGDTARFVLDVKQSLRSDEDPCEMARVLGSKIVHIHFSDHNDQHDCMMPGEGTFDIRSFLEIMHRSGYDGAVMLELYRSSFRDTEQLAEGCRYLESIINSIQEGDKKCDARSADSKIQK